MMLCDNIVVLVAHLHNYRKLGIILGIIGKNESERIIIGSLKSIMYLKVASY